MRATIAIGFIAAIMLSLAPAANAAPDGFTFHTQQAPPRNATPIPKLQVAACTFRPCNCRPECVIYDGDRCVRSVRTCDTCSSCD